MTNHVSRPSMELWRSLYAAADAFLNAAPWKMLSNEMLFGVEDPASKQIGWCSVMGDGGMEYGLCVNRGARGFKAFIGMMNQIRHEDLLPLLDSINLTFDHSDFLESRDLAVVAELGVGSRYKGTQKWPRFRSYLPARYPWYLNADEAVFLKAAVEQAIEVARMAAIDSTFLVKGSPDRFLVRVQTKTSGALAWGADYKAPESYVEPQRKRMEIDAAKLTRINSLPVNNDMQLEADLFITSTPVCDSEPPWLPWLMLAVDVKSDYVYRPEYMIKDSDPIVEGSRHLISILEGLRHRPCRIRIQHEQWYEYLQKPCADLGIRLERVTSLPALQKVKEAMSDFMRWDKTILDS